MTTPRRAGPAQRLAELLETLTPEERQEISAWLLDRSIALGFGSFAAPYGYGPARLATALGQYRPSALQAGEDSQLVTIRLPAERHAELRTWCTEHGFTMAAVVRGLVERFLEGQGRAATAD